jgi:hypothetical protein
MAHPTLRGERGRVGRCTLDDQRPVEPIGPRGEREEAGCPGGHGLQQGRPGHAVERVPEVQLQGHVPGAARQARPKGVADALATPRDADPELQGSEARPVSRQAAIAQRLARRTHTSPMAIGRTPLPPGFARAMRAEARREGMSGRMPLMIKFISARMAEVAVGEVPVAARRWSYVHPLRPIAANGGVGTVRTAGASRQREGVAASALEGAEGVEGPDGTRAAACRQRRLAVVRDEAKEARWLSGDGVTVRERRSLAGAGEGVDQAEGPGEDRTGRREEGQGRGPWSPGQGPWGAGPWQVWGEVC